MFKKSISKFNFKRDDNSLEKKIFKIILYFALLMSVINLFLNLIVGFELIINIKWLLMIFLSMFILKSMQKNYFEFFQLKMTFYLILVFIFFPLAWFQSGGSANNGIAYTFLIFISITFLFERKAVRNFFIFSLIGVFMLSFSLEYFYPDLLISHSPTSQFVDKLIQTPVILLASYLLLLQFERAYREEKNKLNLSTKKLEMANEKLQKIASRDPLTEKFNRRAFDQKIREIFENDLHLKKDITLILFDIDNFKDINDSYGHDRGDEVLIKLAEELENTLPQNTLISRWGGDEFAVICQKSEIESQSYLDRYYENVDSLSEKLGIEITVSAGLSRLKRDDEVQELFKRVDDILYKAKENGKAQYTVA